jgi:hypothetical protein
MISDAHSGIKAARKALVVIHNISLPPKEFGNDYIEQFFTNKCDRNPTISLFLRQNRFRLLYIAGTMGLMLIMLRSIVGLSVMRQPLPQKLNRRNGTQIDLIGK